MRSMIRRAAAAGLVCALTALPLLLDRCADICTAHTDAADAGAPSCHEESAALGITSAPTPCGHDHHGPAAIAAKAGAPDQHIASVIASLEASRTFDAPLPRLHSLVDSSPPQSRGTPSLRAFALRI
jgi:hypothetical protein